MYSGARAVLAEIAEVCCSRDYARSSRTSALRMLAVLVHKHTPNRLILNELLCKHDGQSVLQHMLQACMQERHQQDDKAHELNLAGAVHLHHRNVLANLLSIVLSVVGITAHEKEE